MNFTKGTETKIYQGKKYKIFFQIQACKPCKHWKLRNIFM